MQLASSYLSAFQLTGDPQYARVVRAVLDYLRRDMTHPEGGLFSAEVGGWCRLGKRGIVKAC